MKTRSLLTGLSVALFLVIPIWIVVINPELRAMPKDYSSHVEFLGIVNWTDPGKDTTSLVMYETHNEKVVSSEDNFLMLQLDTTAQNLLNGEVFWQSNDNLTINAKTRKYKDQDAYLFFPNHLNGGQDIESMKFYSYLPITKFKFEREEAINGENNYFVYSYDISALESSESYPLWAAEGHDILMDDWGYVWVEPTSGYVVNAEDNWKSYLKDNSSKTVDEGRIWYTKDTINNQRGVANEARQMTLLFEVLIPILIGVMALAFAITALVDYGYDLKMKKRKK